MIRCSAIHFADEAYSVLKIVVLRKFDLYSYLCMTSTYCAFEMNQRK